MQCRDAGRVLHKADDRKLGRCTLLIFNQDSFRPTGAVPRHSLRQMPSICIALSFSTIAAPSIAKSSL